MKRVRITLPLSLAVLLGWLVLTIAGGWVGSGSKPESLADAATGSIGVAWIVAALFAGWFAFASQDRSVTGVGAPDPLRSTGLAWLPLLYAVFALLIAFTDESTIPPAAMLTLAVNMAAVALSEELMFRGVLLAGLLTRYTAWQSVLACSAIFGLVHALNGFTTGEVTAALWQCAGAFLQGVGYAAIRLRTRSVWPMAVVHGMWDFSLMLHLLSAPPEETAPLLPWASLLLVLPIFLYGLYLMRGARGALPHATPAEAAR